jgi:hydrogenase nickel incorporation protein HypA/HybF
MHELSIALELVELAGEAAARLDCPSLVALHVRLGPMAGVVEDALAFSFELAAAGTPAEGARLVIEHAPLIAFCSACDAEKTIATPQHLRCPDCGGFTPDVRSGRDLQLVAVEIPDVEDCGNPPEHSEEKRSARG